MSDLQIVLEYLSHQWLPIEVKEAYYRLLKEEEHLCLEEFARAVIAFTIPTVES